MKSDALRRLWRAAPRVGLALSTIALAPASCHLISGHDDLTPRRAAPGEPCARDDDCESDHCAQGVCCDRACSLACSACNLDGDVGRCTARPVGPDPEELCEGVCNGSGSCVSGGLLSLATIGDGTSQHVNSLAVDGFDEIIVGGTYDGALQLGALSPPPTAATTPFVAHYSTNGMPSGPLYAGDLLGAITQVEAFSVGATMEAEVVVVGSAIGSDVDLWLHVPELWASPLTLGGPGSQTGLSALGHPSGVVVLGSYGLQGAVLGASTLPGVDGGAFVALLDGEGQIVTSRGIGDDVAVGAGGIAVDGSGAIYVTGRYEGVLSSDVGPLIDRPPLTKGKPPEALSGDPDAEEVSWLTGTGPGVFVLRLAADLSVSWATALAGAPGQTDLPLVTPLGTDRLAVAFDHVTAGNPAHVVALDATSGQPLWTESIDATPKSLAGNEDGVIVAGSIVVPIAFAGGELPLLEGTTTAIVAAYDENGGQRWGRAIAPGQARASAVDTQGHVLVGGRYSGTFDLGIGSAASTTDTDGFLAEMTGDGEPLWQRSLGSTEPQQIRAMFPYKGDIVVGGAFDRAMSVGMGSSLSPTGEDDGYVTAFTRELEAKWLTKVSGQGAQTVTALTGTETGAVVVAVCANQEVEVNAEIISTGQGTTLFDIENGTGIPLDNVLSIHSPAPLECDAPLGLAHHAGELFVAGHIPELAFERRAYIKRLRASTFEPLQEREFDQPGPERITGLAIDDTAAVVSGYSQSTEGGNQGFVKSFTRLTLDDVAEHRFSAETVLLHHLGDGQLAAVLASSSSVRIAGEEIQPQGSTTNGYLAILQTPALELVRLVGLGPMHPRALEVDTDGNLVLAGELTEAVDWDGEILAPDGTDSFVLKVAPTGQRLAALHVSGDGKEVLVALAAGLEGVVHAGGTFDGSLIVDQAPPRFGSGTDSLILSMGR